MIAQLIASISTEKSAFLLSTATFAIISAKLLDLISDRQQW